MRIGELGESAGISSHRQGEEKHTSYSFSFGLLALLPVLAGEPSSI